MHKHWSFCRFARPASSLKHFGTGTAQRGVSGAREPMPLAKAQRPRAVRGLDRVNSLMRTDA